MEITHSTFALKLSLKVMARAGTVVIVALAMSQAVVAQPSIQAGGIVNVSGELPILAPNVVFAVYGQNLGPASIVIATAPDYPASLSGTSLTFTPTAGGSPIIPKLVYTESIAVAAILPSTIAPGTYAVRVTYQNQTSAPQNVTVVARAFDIATANGIGTGTAQATIGNINGGYSLTRFTSSTSAPVAGTFTNTPAHPLDVVSLWGTGGGADLANDTGGSSGDQTAAGNFQVILDGQSITPAYAGAVAGYPGLWVVIFTVPAGITPDCFMPIQVSSNEQLSNQAILPTAAAGQTSCAGQISAATLSKLDSGGNIVMAAPIAGESFYTSGGTTSVFASLGAIFNQYTAAEFLIPYSGPKFGPCRVLDQTYPVNGKEPSAADAALNAGTIQYSGPGISGSTTGTTGGIGPVYLAPVSSLQLGGTYTLTGLGGTQIGPFPTITTTLPSSFTVTNFNSLTSINRSQPLTISWTGTGFDQVLILLIDDVVTTTTVHGVAVSCAVDASLGSYTIPAAALAYLPGGSVQVEVEAVKNAGGDISAESGTSTSFRPPLVGGGQVDFGAFSPYLAYIRTATVQ